MAATVLNVICQTGPLLMQRVCQQWTPTVMLVLCHVDQLLMQLLPEARR